MGSPSFQSESCSRALEPEGTPSAESENLQLEHATEGRFDGIIVGRGEAGLAYVHSPSAEQQRDEAGSSRGCFDGHVRFGPRERRERRSLEVDAQIQVLAVAAEVELLHQELACRASPERSSTRYSPAPSHSK